MNSVQVFEGDGIAPDETGKAVFIIKIEAHDIVGDEYLYSGGGRVGRVPRKELATKFTSALKAYRAFSRLAGVAYYTSKLEVLR